MTVPLTPVQSYWQASRAHRYSLLFALPLLIAYELLAAVLSGPSGGVRNGADVLLKALFIRVVGVYGPLLFGVAVIGVSVWLIARDTRSGGRIQPRVFAVMLAESVVLALLFGVVVGTLTAQLLGSLGSLSASLSMSPLEEMGWWTRLMLSLGAGLYEELLFRVLLVSALVWVASAILGPGRLAAAAAAVAGALIFSAFHYIGPYADALQLQSFTFRFLAGLVFSVLFLARGFGITAWTHALYDVFLMVV
ncbi:MAG: CPBP family glutamic-type intramembrane protease [Gemmatimonadaceae bacterium]